MPAKKGSPDLKPGHAAPARAKKTPAPRRKAVASEAPTQAEPQSVLTVVGMVASAGGLEAFKQFFLAMPPDSGMTFLLTPHLDPTHESLMTQLLGKHTAMPVTEAQDGQTLEANHVYVIPPNRYMSLHQGAIQLSAPPPERGAGENAIDPFLRSLALDQQERAVCIILSGTGTHGSLGLKAVKAEGGMAMVQEPSSAEYDRMPLSAIDTGLADYTLPPGKMPEALIKYVQHFVAGVVAQPEPTGFQNDLTQVLALLRARTRYDFRPYRKRMLLRRIQRRMGLNHLDQLGDYLAQLRERPEELTQLCRDLLISVTSFFRDPEMFHMLETQVIPDLIDARDSDAPIRVWVPGCATGEEAYSIAIQLIERIAATGKACPIQIFATDVDEAALDVGRRGIYLEAMMTELGRKRLERFFTRIDDHSWQVNKQLRETVLFAPQNILADAPFSKLDLVSCRNLLIYLEPDAQQKLLKLFHFSLNEGSYLILGPSESIGRQTSLYQPVSKQWRIFRRLNTARRSRAGFPVQGGERISEFRLPPPAIPVQSGNLSVSDLIRKVLLEDYTPAAVVINQHYEVLHFSGPTQQYLQQPGGPPSHDLLTLSPVALRPRIRSAVLKAMNEDARIDVSGIRIKRAEQLVLVHLAVQPLLSKPGAEGLLLVTFQDEREIQQQAGNEQARTDEQLVRQLEYELKTSREELQSTIEELESSNEEFKASNEEAMSMNEELQSTNEELETSREELQSLNEELSTVNTQLRDKLDELADSHNDMTNLLGSVDNATLFLAVDHTIQRFTPSATRLFNLIATDVGRPIGHITACVDDPELLQDIDRVLQDLAPCEREVSRDNDQWFLRRIAPYRTADNHISGVVLTLTDITALKRAELDLRSLTANLEQRVSESSAQLQHERNFIDTILNTVGALILVVDAEERVVRFNTACNTATGYDFAEFQGSTKWHDLVPGDERDGVRQVCDRLRAGEDQVLYENHWRHHDGSQRLIRWCNSVLRDEAGNLQYIIGTGIDITEQRRAENTAQEVMEEASHLQRLQTANELATLLAHEINQPLAAIATYATTGLKLLQHLPLEPDRLTRNLEQISQQSLRAGQILRHLRAYVSRDRVDPVPLDVNALVRNAGALMEPKTRSRGIKLVLKLDNALPQVMGVGLHIEQVLFNLMRNAIDAIRDAGMKSGSITLKTRQQDGMARISVCDTGPGLDAEQAEKAFEPLTSQKKYGLGVGLRISLGLIEAHNGRLWVEPHRGGGIFHFVLPLAL